MPDDTGYRTGHVIVAGFGVPGRVVADLLEKHGVPYCVVELNPKTCERCQLGGVPIHAGDVTDPQVLRSAGIESASLVVIVIPDEKAALEATRQARELNRSVRIVTRCHFTSAGMTARTLGADEVIIAEQVVANEAARIVSSVLDAKSDGAAQER